MKVLLLGISLALSAGTAMAQEDLRIDQSKLYVSDPAACQLIEDKGIDAFMDLDFLSLTFARGIQSMEFQCNFFDVKSREGNNFLFVDAICELPGEVYPDTLAITPFSDSEIQVVSAYDTAMVAAGVYEPTNQGTSPGATVFHRCDNLSEIPVD